MVKKLKQKIRENLEEKYNTEYRKEWNEKKLGYEKWVREQQTFDKKSYQSLAFEMLKKKVSLITWEQLENAQNLAELKLKDIVVFVENKTGLLDEALDKITSVFYDNAEIKVVYGDEDETNKEDGNRRNPWFKPDYSPDTLISYYYFGGLVAFRKEVLKNISFESGWSAKEKIYAITLQACLPLDRKLVCHYKDMLYTSSEITYWGFEDSYKKVKEKYADIRPKAKEDGVSIIIPSKDNPKVLERCLESIVNLTEDVKYEIVVIDNGSNEENRKYIEEMKTRLGFQYIYNPMEFNFSVMCNTGASYGTYSIYLFLNDDCEVRHSDWLRKMTDQALILDTGAVGVKLHYPNSKTIQHCGVYSLQVGPAHKLQFKEDTCVYYDRRNLDVRNVLASTGACLMIRKDVFEEVKRFDEGLRVAFNDVDLCYKIYEAGYNIVNHNEVQLWHHESLSRGNDNDPDKIERHMGEREALYQRHPDLWGNDPYYHPGLLSHHLDVNFSFVFEFDYDMENALSQFNRTERYGYEPYKKLKALPAKIREDNCLVPMIEYAGDVRNWHVVGDNVADIMENLGNQKIAYFQGNIVVLGSNNAYYKKSVVLRHVESGQFYMIEPARKHRPDLYKNLPDQENVALSGFSFLMDMNDMPEGSYEISVMAKDMISGQYLYRTTPMRLEN